MTLACLGRDCVLLLAHVGRGETISVGPLEGRSCHLRADFMLGWDDGQLGQR